MRIGMAEETGYEFCGGCGLKKRRLMRRTERKAYEFGICIFTALQNV